MKALDSGTSNAPTIRRREAGIEHMKTTLRHTVTFTLLALLASSGFAEQAQRQPVDFKNDLVPVFTPRTEEHN